MDSTVRRLRESQIYMRAWSSAAKRMMAIINADKWPAKDARACETLKMWHGQEERQLADLTELRADWTAEDDAKR